MRKAAKKDLTHDHITEIIQELRDKWGAPIQFKDTHQLKNFGDFILTFGGKLLETNRKHRYPAVSEGVTIIVEVKTGDKLLTDGEWDYAKSCYGNYAVINCFEDLIFAMKILCKDHEKLDDIYHLDNVYHTKILKKAAPYEWIKNRSWGN